MQTGAAARNSAQPAAPGAVTKKPEVMDDFLRNFFVKMGLSRTCEAFEAEWYEMKATGRLDGSSPVPDVYLRNAVSGARLRPPWQPHMEPCCPPRIPRHLAEELP